MEVSHHLRITTHCPVCAKMFTDPKILPCLHTFCSKCLESIASKANKTPGSNVHCAVCRKGFSIPQEGIAKLQNSYFLERLVTLTMILNATDRLCDACMEGIDSPSAINKVSVRMYCFNCSMKFCDDCYKHHRKSKLTETHKVIDITNQSVTAELMEMFAPSLCEQHKNEMLKLYCTDCENIICAMCYIENHQGHRFSDVKIAAHQFRTKLQASIDDVTAFVEHTKPKQRQLEERKSEIVKKIGYAKIEVEKRRVELKRLVDKQADLLVTKLGSLKEEKLKEIETEKEDISRHAICLQSYKFYIAEVVDKATSGYTCQAVKSITARAFELKEINGKIIQRQLPPFEVSFWATDLEKFLSSDDGNILGLIQADRVENQTRTLKDKNTKETKELLTKITQLTHELEIEKLTSQEKIRNFNQQLDRERTSNCILQDLVEKLRQNLTKETACNRNHRELISKLQANSSKQATDCLSSNKVSELEKVHGEERQKWMMKEKLLTEKVTELQQEMALLNHMRASAQKQLEDEREEKKTLDSKIKKCLENERELLKEKTSLATKEKQLNELVEQLNRQERESSQLMNKLKQEAASQRLLCNSLKVGEHALQEKQNILQAELHSVKKERDSQANRITEATAIQERERTEKTAAIEQLKSITLQLKQAEEVKLRALKKCGAERKKIQEMEEKLLDCERTITKFQKRQSELGKLLFKQHPDTIDYKDVQASVQKLVSVPSEARTITGLTICNGILYITREHSHIIESYDSTTFAVKQRLLVTELSNPRDVKGTKHKCLYIFDMKSLDQPKEIFIFDLNLKAIQKRWSTGDDYGSLSIADDENVILTVHSTNRIKEYTSGGQLVREITISSTVSNLLHSIKLTNGYFVVSHGPERGICIADETGEVLKSFGEENSLWLEGCLTVDSSGCIMVADEMSGRVLLLSPTLEFKRELVSRKHGLKIVTKIHLDESNGSRLFVADDCLISSIHVFKFGPQHQPEHQPVTEMQIKIEKTVQYLGRHLPSSVSENELNDALVRVIQSQGTLRVARAIGGLAFMVFLIVGLLLSICFILFLSRLK